MKQLTFLALVAIFSISTGSVMAQKNSPTNKNKATLSGPKLNSSSKTSATSASSVGKKGQLTNKARSACIKGVWKLAKTQHYGPKGETVEVKSKLEYACTKLRNMVKMCCTFSI